jgi:hypothetical protein
MANRTTQHEREEAPTGDPLGGKTEEPEVDEERARRAANLFDLRRLIGGLFIIYGVILTVMGIGASDAEIDKAAGINMNLWVGLSMLGVGALFLLWAFARPLSEQLEEDEEPEEEPKEDDRTVRGAPAPVGPDAAAFAGSETTSRRARRDRAGTGGEQRFRR